MTILRRILIVDDDEKDVKLTMKALSDSNLANQIDIVHDGEQALDYLHRRGQFHDREVGNPVVILLDIKMPKVDGIQVLREVRETDHLRCIPVVMLSSSREENDLIESYDLGVNAYVVKPVKFKDFIDVVRQIKVFWALINETPPYERLSELNEQNEHAENSTS